MSVFIGKVRYSLPRSKMYLEDLLSGEDHFTPETLDRVSEFQAAVLERVTVPLQRSGEHPLVLDVGCGNSKMAGFIQGFRDAKAKVIPLELSAKALGLAREALKPLVALNPVVADGLYLPFKARSFNGVLLCQLLEFLPRSERFRAISEAFRVAKPGGIVLIASMQARQQAEYELDLHRQHETGMLCEPVKQTELLRTISDVGFKLTGVEGISAYRPNDFFLVTLQKGANDGKGKVTQAPVRPEEKETQARRRRTALWE